MRRCEVCNARTSFDVCADCEHARANGFTSVCVHADWLFIGNVYSTEPSALARHRITHVVSAFRSRLERPADVAFLDIALNDSPYAGLEDAVTRTLGFIDAARAASPDARVLVHCYAGISRSSALIVAYLVSQPDAPTYAAVLASVRAAHPRACPNVGFERQLERYARAVRADGGIEK